MSDDTIHDALEISVEDTAAKTASRVAGRIADRVTESTENAVESGIAAGVGKAVEIIQTDADMRAWQSQITDCLARIESILASMPSPAAVPVPEPVIVPVPGGPALPTTQVLDLENSSPPLLEEIEPLGVEMAANPLASAPPASPGRGPLRWIGRR